MDSITILDGGMGKELERIGAPFRQPEWSALALWEAPDAVAQAHRNFIAAGAEVIITNTYAVVPYHIGDERYRADGRDLVELAARIAREVADASDRPIRVAGSLPPQFGSYQPDLFEPERAPAMYQMMVEAQAPYVDLWVAETLSCLAEFEAVAAAVAQSPLPFWAAFSLQENLVDGCAMLHSGEPVDEALRVAASRCDAFLFNCARPEVIGPAIATVTAYVGDAERPRIGGYANAFPMKSQDGGYSPRADLVVRRDDLTADRYGDFVASWVASGATIIGGCCGIHPEQIAALANRFAG